MQDAVIFFPFAQSGQWGDPQKYEIILRFVIILSCFNSS